MKKPAKPAARAKRMKIDPTTVGQAHFAVAKVNTHTVINGLATMVRLLNDKWWRDLKTGRPLKRNRAEQIALIHSELSETLEAVRKDTMDEKLPHRKGEEVELADALIRILDYAGGHKLDLGGALVEKLAYNMTRADHKVANRLKAGGKKF